MAGTLGGDVIQVGVQPIAARPTPSRCENLHLLARPQLVVERDEAAVDHCTPATMAYLAVDLIGKIDRRGALGQIDDVPFGGENVDAIGENVALHRVYELASVVYLLSPIGSLAQPSDLGLEGGVAWDPLFVAPMSSDPIFGDLMHLLGTNLYLKGLAIEADHGCVQRLIQVALGHGHIVIKLSRDRPPDAVQGAQHVIAELHLVNDDAHAMHIVDLVKVARLGLHLSIDAVDVFGSPGYLRIDTFSLKAICQNGYHPLQILLPFRLPLGQEPGDLAIALRVKIAKRKVLQLRLELPDTQAAGKRGKDLEGLSCLTKLRLGREILQSTHVMQAIGQLDDQHANITHHGQEHLAQVLRLFLCGIRGPDVALSPCSAKLGHPVNEFGNRLAKLALELRESYLSVFEDIMENPCRDARHIHAEVGENGGDFKRVYDKGIPRFASLGPVVGRGIVDGMVQQVER